jgi:hypothetical protein
MGRRVPRCSPCAEALAAREDVVSIKHLLRTLLVCLPLGLGSLMGVPMRPEEIEELMHNLNQPKITITIPDDSESGDGDEVSGVGS